MHLLMGMCFHFLVILKKFVVKIHVSVWTNIFISLDLRVKWLTHSIGKHLTLRNCQSNCTILHSHQQSILCHPIQNFNLYRASHLFTHITQESLRHGREDSMYNAFFLFFTGTEILHFTLGIQIIILSS